MNIENEYQKIIYYSKEKTNLEKLLNENFSNKVAIYYFLHCKYKTPRMYRKLRNNIDKYVNHNLKNHNLYEINDIKKLVGEKIFKASLFSLSPKESQVLMELLNGQNVYTKESIIDYISNKLDNLKEEDVNKLEIYLYILLEIKEYNTFNIFVKYVLDNNTKIKYIKQISKCITRYGETKIELTNENIQILLWKYANNENLDILKKLLSKYNKVYILESRIEHLKLHQGNIFNKSFFLDDPIKVLKQKFNEKKDFDVYYDSKLRNIVMYIKCDECIGKSNKFSDLYYIKVILDNLGRIITAYPAFYQF